MRKVAVVLAVVLMACGGGGGAATSDTIDPKVSDQLTADNVVVQASDLPGSFASSSSSSSNSSSSSSDDAQLSSDVNECVRTASGLDLNGSDKNRTAKAKRAFKTGQGLDAVTVEGTTEVYHDAGNLSGQLTAIAKPEVAECFRKGLIAVFESRGATVGDITLTPIKVEGVGDEQAGYLVGGPVTINGVDVNFASEVDFTRVGRFALTATIDSLNGTPDHNLAVTAMKAMVSRIPR